MDSNLHTIQSFILRILVEEVRDIQQKGGHHYLSFGLITQGIEFLGSFFDEEEFHTTGMGKQRFRKAIAELFPERYDPYNFDKSPYDLYRDLRCGLVHSVLPKTSLELIKAADKGRFGGDHLDIKMVRGKEKLLLVAEDFFKDYEGACVKLISRIEEGNLQGLDPKKADLKKTILYDVPV